MYTTTSLRVQRNSAHRQERFHGMCRTRSSFSRTSFCCLTLILLTVPVPSSASHSPSSGRAGASSGRGDVKGLGLVVGDTSITFPSAGAEVVGEVAAMTGGASAGRTATGETGASAGVKAIVRTETRAGASLGGSSAILRAQNGVESSATGDSARVRTPREVDAIIREDLLARGESGAVARIRIPRQAGTATSSSSSTSDPKSSSKITDNGNGGLHYNFTLAFLTAVQNNGPGKFTAGAFFLALDHLNNATESRLNGSQHSASFHYVFRDTHNLETTATRAMVDLYCGDVDDVSVFIGPDVFCNSAALLASSFDRPYLSYDCNDIHTLRTNIHKYLMVNLEPSLAYVAKSIVAVMRHYAWTSFWLITGTGVTSNAWTDTGQELRIQARAAFISLTDVTRENLNDEYHIMIRNQKPYRKIIEETRYKTRVYVFLGQYNSLLEFLQELDSAGVTSGGEHVVIAVDDRPLLGSDSEQGSANSSYFLSTEHHGKAVTASRLAAFRNVLLLTRQEPTNETTEEFRYHVYEKNYSPPIHLKRIPPWWPGKKKHDLLQESVYLYDAVTHYGNVVLDLIKNGKDPYNASLVSHSMRNIDIKSIQGFKVHINQDGESEGRYVLRSLAYNDRGGPVADMWKVGSFSIHDGTTRYLPDNLTYVTWVAGQVPISNPPCGFDGSKCGGGAAEQSEWKLVAVGIGLAVIVLIVIIAVFVGLRYWLIVRRMRRQALAAARIGCANSFLELQEQDREGLLVC